MEYKTDIIFKDNIINKSNSNKNETIKKNRLISKITKINLSQKYSKTINFFLFEMVFLLLPNIIISEFSIEIKVNKVGYNQIFSDEYKGPLPKRIIYNEIPILILNKKIEVNSLDNRISLIWNNFPGLNFSFMFSNLTSINYINMNFELQNNFNMSYMFYNCYNLEEFKYDIINNDYSYSNIDMSKMFYNCSLLKTFNFNDLNLNNVNTSYMFFNCQSLKEINFNSDIESNDMKGMFYNCISLEEINLENIQTSNYIDISYMFYNCNNMTSFIINNIQIKEMKYMFYNCSSISTIELDFINSTSPLNMSYLFYNCNSLEEIQGSFENLSISDTSKMFYNCTSLESLYFNPKNVSKYINMTKMFYNCENLDNINFTISENNNNNNNDSNYSYFYPNDLSYIFANCINLTSIEFNFFKTDFVKEISYMMFNCKNLTDISMVNSNFSNSLITSMKGMFQNCESLTTLDLSLFYTSNVKIMWDMFKGCKSLEFLNLSNFETSNVKDMESMFEGCESLISLDLTNFNTSNVHYMNKMFSNCTNLEALYFNYISSESLGTMYQMFYNCKSLKYLNIYSLTENAQSIYEMFEGVSDNFTFCINDNENIPNIFKEILNIENAMRDCSDNCYGIGKERFNILSKKLCCPKFEYNENCYDKCPQRTKVFLNDSKNCLNFSCSSNYNYEQDDCLDEIPEGYYLNDTELKTIDKCHKNCKTCLKGPTEYKENCLSCNEPLIYQFLSNCFNSCDYGHYNDSGILKCRCVTEECSDCSEESLEQNLCISCAEGYYTKENDIINSTEYIKCYKDPPKYYLKNETQNYHKCYPSCDKCYGPGNEYFHNCLICDSNYAFEITQNISGYITKNCYENCTYYYYFENNTYLCTKTNQCPPNFDFIIAGTKQCVKSCNETEGYFKQFRNYCYKECPLIISKEREDNPNLCKVICPYEFPFELVETQICVESCSIIERSTKLCVTNNFENRTNLELQEIIYDDIVIDLTNSFNYSIITDYKSVIIEENNTIYEIVSSNNKNPNSKTSKIDFGKCDSLLKNFYGIEQNKSLIILKMDTYIEGKTGPTSVYEIFYPMDNSESLVKLSLTPCEGEKISVLYSMELTNPILYDKNNPIYTDICFPYSLKGGVDTTLGDMQKDYANNNKSLCEEDCEYDGYDEENKFFKCNCDMKESLPKISEIKSDKSKLYAFDEINKIGNFDVLRCTNLITKKEGLIHNYGFYSFIPTFIVYIICLFVFYKKEKKVINDNINKLIYAKRMSYINKLKRDEEKRKNEEFIRIIIKQKTSRMPVFASYLKDNSKSNILQNDIINNININKNAQFKYSKIKPNRIIFKKKLSEKKINIYNSGDIMNSKSERNFLDKVEDKIKGNDVIIMNRNKLKNNPPIKKPNNKNNKKNDKYNFDEKICSLEERKISHKSTELNEKEDIYINEEDMKINEILKYNDKELNDLTFKLAIKYDNRTFCQYYLSLLRSEHVLIKIYNSRDYNSKIIKLYLALYNFDLSFAVNALFFDDETIEQIFADGGKFNLLYQIPQIIYSSFISLLFSMSLDVLALSEDNILIFKSEKISNNMLNNARKTSIILQLKFLYFFILSFIFLLLIWYYITCFCAVYKNTQYHLIKDTIIGFANSLISPFALKLIPGIFRLYGLKHKNVFIYKLNKILEMIC